MRRMTDWRNNCFRWGGLPWGGLPLLFLAVLILLGGRHVLAQEVFQTCLCQYSWQVLNNTEDPFRSDLPEVLSDSEIKGLSWQFLPSRKAFQRRSVDYWSPSQSNYWMRFTIPQSLGQPSVSNNIALAFYNLPQYQSIFLGSKKVWQQKENEKQGPRLITLSHYEEAEQTKYIYVHYRISSFQSARKFPQMIVVGAPDEMFLYSLTHDVFSFLISLLTIGVGILLFIFFLINREQKVLFYLFIFSTGFGLSELPEYDIFAFWFPTVSTYLLVFFFIFPIGILGFYRNVYEIKYKRIIDFMFGTHIVYAFIAIFLIIYDEAWLWVLRDFNLYVLLSIDIFLFIFTVFPLIYQDKQNTKFTLAGFIALPVLGGISIAQDVFVLPFPHYPFINVGMVFFLVSLLEMVYRRFQQSRKLVIGYTQELEKKNKELSQLDQLKDEFLAKTSHELRTPLHGIIGIADSLIDNITLPHAVLQERAGIIIQSARRLNYLINDILDSASLKAQSLQLKTVPLSLFQTINAVFDIVQPIAVQKSVRLINGVLRTVPLIQADEERLQQILLNLIGNALKFTEQGQIEIQAEVVEAMLEVSVSDTGSGIDPEQHQKLFQAFETGSTNQSGQGTGLGLSITQDLVRLHGGEVWLEQEVTQGTQFVFSIPLSEAKSHPIEEMKVESWNSGQRPIEILDGQGGEAESRNPGRRPDDTQQMGGVASYTILIVDDEPINQQILKTQLDSKGFELHFASSGKQALEKIEEQKPDLILLDVMMPEMDGFELCSQLRQEESLINLPIIFLTAKTQVNDIVQGFSSGGNDYLPKPFSKEELFARIKTQFQILTAKDRLISLRSFSNQIGQFQDTEKLIEAAFEVMSETLQVESAGLFQGKKLLKSFQNDHIELWEDNEGEDMPSFYISKDGNHLKTSISSPAEYTFVMNKRNSFSAIDQEYTQNMIDQLRITQENLYALASDPKKLEMLSFIANGLEEILYIQSERNYCTIVKVGEKGVPELHRISLKGIKLYFSDKNLLQIHRSYLINPNQVWRFEFRARNKSQLFFGDTFLPIGSSYLETLDKAFPQFQVLKG